MTEPTLYPESGFLRLKIDLAYDGTNYYGWAKQPDHRTIQEELETALSTITQCKVETIVAGRTDAGVHATGQVIHVDVPDITNLDELAFKLNRMLNEDIRINNVAIAPPAPPRLIPLNWTTSKCCTIFIPTNSNVPIFTPNNSRRDTPVQILETINSYEPFT